MTPGRLRRWSNGLQAFHQGMLLSCCSPVCFRSVDTSFICLLNIFSQAAHLRLLEATPDLEEPEIQQLHSDMAGLVVRVSHLQCLAEVSSTASKYTFSA